MGLSSLRDDGVLLLPNPGIVLRLEGDHQITATGKTIAQQLQRAHLGDLAGQCRQDVRLKPEVQPAKDDQRQDGECEEPVFFHEVLIRGGEFSAKQDAS